MPVYLIHFEQPYHHARHYVGYACDIQARLEQHQQGRGARLMSVIRQAGISWVLARTWQGGRTLERRLKQRKNAPRLCPLCIQARYVAAHPMLHAESSPRLC